MRLWNRFARQLLASAGLMVLLVLLAGCSGHDPQDTLNPQGHVAAVIKGLFYPIFWVAVAVFVFIEGLIIYIMARYRDRGGRELPVQTHGNTRLEITWTAIPALMMVGIAIPTITTLVQVNNAPAGSMEINVIGHQWWWEFQYPNEKVVTADELHIPAGVPVHVNLHSADVIHSFWVPTLAGKQDIIPNHDGDMWLSAYRPGTYSAQCAQFCGEQHGLMEFKVVADSQDDFAKWVKDQQAAAGLTSSQMSVLNGQQTTGDAAAEAFQKIQCGGCHTINGTKAGGQVGPNLTHFASRAWFEEMQNNPDNVARWLTDTQSVKHGNDMKIGRLSDDDVKALTQMLGNLK